MSDFVSEMKQSLPAGTKMSRKKGVSSSESSVYISSAEQTVRYKCTIASSIKKGSEEYSEYMCDPCNTEGDHVEAHGYCTNCGDYLCGTCFKSHSKNKASRNHVLLDKDNMPKKCKLCDPCKRDDDKEEAAGYCTDCGEYLCNSCFRSHSRNKASRQHVLLDKDDMPGWTDSAFTSSVAKMIISGRDADSQQYNEKYTHIRDINVKTNEDKKDCFISGITLVNGTELVLADQYNKSLKLVDLENHVIKDSLRLQKIPVGLTTIFLAQVAVVLYEACKIQIISVSRERLSLVRDLSTNGHCVAVKCVNEKLYVSFKEPVKFQILQLTGAVYKTIEPCPEVLKHCTHPVYIAVSPDESMIYISDRKTNTVLCMDMDGTMISTYQEKLKKPHDIIISPFGSVYLCNQERHVVYKMTSVLSDVTVILGRGDGLVYPSAMCFNADKQHLYTSSGSGQATSSNVIKVHEWK